MIQPRAILRKLKMARISSQDRARIVGLVEGGMPYNQVSVLILMIRVKWRCPADIKKLHCIYVEPLPSSCEHQWRSHQILNSDDNHNIAYHQVRRVIYYRQTV